MGQADSMSRRGNKSDNYLTPPGCVRALLDAVPSLKHRQIHDPCSGTGVFGRVFKEYGVTHTEADITTGIDFLNNTNTYDVISANPPYSLKNEFISMATLYAKDVYMLLPRTVDSYNRFQTIYKDNSLYRGLYSMRPKFFMTEEETNYPKKGGIHAYAWYHWGNGAAVDKFERFIDLKDYLWC